MTRVAIIGGGISGLAAAYALEELKRDSKAAVDYVLFEASPRFGGVLRSEQVESFTVEAGPDSFLTEKPQAADLCRSLGLGDQLIGSNDAQRVTYVVLKNRLIPLPDGLLFMVPTRIAATLRSPLFSWKAKAQIARELFHPPRANEQEANSNKDESVASFVERHYGREMVDRLADPLLSGIYGGNSASLSVRAVLPRFVEMERAKGSLGRAMLAARKQSSRPSGAVAPPLFTSLRGGLQQLVDALVASLPVSSLLVGTPVQALQLEEVGGWLVSAGMKSDQFDAVILAIPAPASATLLKNSAPQLAAELEAIPYTSSITVALGYGSEVRQSLPPGFGFLVPRNEGRHLLATTFVHNKFPHRAPPDRALLRCFIAAEKAESVLNCSDDAIVDIVRNDLRQILNVSAQPVFSRVYRWKSAMAQYTVGHLERLDRIERLCQGQPGLALAGNGYRGIGIPDCIRSGFDAARRALAVENT